MTFTIDEEFITYASGDARYPLSSALHSAVNGSGNVNVATPFVSVTPASGAGWSQTFSIQMTGSTGSLEYLADDYGN